MASVVNWYHAHIDAVSRSEGKSAVGLAAYITGETMKDERTGLWCKRNHPGEVLDWGTVAPPSAPAYLSNDEQLSKAWNAVEKSEKRSNSHVANHWNIASSREFSETDNIEVARKMAQTITARYGVMVTWAVHKPTDHGKDTNWHIHLGYNMRRIDAAGFGEKAREITAKESRVEETIWQRKVFADVINERLELIGSNERVSHETYARQGKDQEPTKHLGSKQHQLELQGISTLYGEENRAIRERNAARAKLKEEHAAITAQIIDLETERLKRGKGTAMSDDTTELHGDKGLSADEITRRRARAGADGDQRPRGEFTQDDLARHSGRETEKLAEAGADRDKIFKAQEKYFKDQEERIDGYQKFEQQRAKEAEWVAHNASQRKQQDEQYEAAGEPANAANRYAQALGSNYSIRDPYGSLANAAMAEYGAFNKQQEVYRQQETKEENPAKRDAIAMARVIEAYEYMAITSMRIASITRVVAGDRNSLDAQRDEKLGNEYMKLANAIRKDRTNLLREIRNQEVDDFHAMRDGKMAENRAVNSAVEQRSHGQATWKHYTETREVLNSQGENVGDKGNISEGLGSRGSKGDGTDSGRTSGRPANTGGRGR